MFSFLCCELKRVHCSAKAGDVGVVLGLNSDNW
jgi:hypothetical protein